MSLWAWEIVIKMPTMEQKKCALQSTQHPIMQIFTFAPDTTYAEITVHSDD